MLDDMPHKGQLSQRTFPAGAGRPGPWNLLSRASSEKTDLAPTGQSKQILPRITLGYFSSSSVMGLAGASRTQRSTCRCGVAELESKRV